MCQNSVFFSGTSSVFMDVSAKRTEDYHHDNLQIKYLKIN